MTDKQPEALRLADALEIMSLSTKWDKAAAKELRRLHAENEALRASNAEMLAVAQELSACESYFSEYDIPLGIFDRINAAITKATGGSA